MRTLCPKTVESYGPTQVRVKHSSLVLKRRRQHNVIAVRFGVFQLAVDHDLSSL